MNETDYFSWLIAFNSYRDKNPNSKFHDLLSTPEGIIKMRQIIEQLYYNKLETHSIKKLIKKTEKKLDDKSLKKLIKKTEKDKIVDLIILKKLKKIEKNNENSVLKNNLKSRTITLSLIETIKEQLDLIEDLDDVINKALEELDPNTLKKQSMKRVTNENDDSSEIEDFYEDLEDADEIDEIDIDD